MNVRNKKLISASAGVALAMTLAACSSSGSGGAVADLTTKPNYSGSISILTAFAGKPMDPYFQGVIKAYKVAHPNVTITLSQETDDNAIKDKEKILVASQSLPDIYFSQAGNWGQNFAENGLAADLSSVISPSTTWGKTFSTGAVNAFKYDGKYYGVPLYNDAKFMGYNKAIFTKLNLSVPNSFDELISDCSTIKSAGYTPIAFGNTDGWPGLHYLQQLIAYNVPRTTIDADINPSTAKWTDPGYITAMNEFTELVTKCTGDGANSDGVTYTTAQQQQQSGKAAMYYQELIEFDSVNTAGSVLNKAGLGIFQLPAPSGAKGDPATLEAAPEGYMINGKSKNAALALDFMKFATNMSNASVLSSPPYGQPSAVIGAVTKSTSSDAVAEGSALVNKASSTIVWLDTATVPTVGDAWISASEGLVTGSLTPRAALQAVQSASEKAK
jgi:raffinose/stachyose/melibiose transport system substrate-binding protein